MAPSSPYSCRYRLKKKLENKRKQNQRLSFPYNFVFLTSQVIGLHRNGYGRILAECMFTSKILYCQWATLAKEDDIFVIKTTKPLPNLNNWSDEEHIKFIRERILGKSNEELARVNISAC